MILSDTSKQYLQEEDAVKGFRAAVENGQSRLALQILTDIVDAFMEIFQEALENPDDSTENVQPESGQPVTAVAAQPEAEPAPVKQPAKKEPKASE